MFHHGQISPRLLVGALALSVALSACAPAPTATPAPSGSQPVAPPAAPAAKKTLVFGVDGEPRGLGQFFIGGTNTMAPIFTMVHDFLVRNDTNFRSVPALAAEVIAQDRGTWTVNPDGTMVTTWRLRPNIKWHDGTPFHAEDLVFGWRVSLHPDVPFSPRRVAELIERMDAPDAQTLVIHWKSPYPFADRLELSDGYALPRHLLQQRLEDDPKNLQNMSYWKGDFVGLGPYKMADWAPGSHMTLEANPDYHLGKPKIDALVHRFIDDENTLVANVLSGEIDIVVPATNVAPQQRQIIKQQWEAAGHGQVMPNLVGRFPHVGIALRNPILQDLRVRQAFIHAFDRAALADTVVLEPGYRTDSWIQPGMERYERARSAIQTYDFNPTRATQLLEEAGYRGGPSPVTGPSGARLKVEYRGATTGPRYTEMSLACANWRTIGIECDETPRAGALAQDPEWRATYQWFDGTSGPASMGFISRRLHSSQVPTAERRWQGSNDGGIRDSDADRLVDLYSRTVNPTEQEGVEIELASLLSRQLYVYPLYREVTSVVMKRGITGPQPMAAVGISSDLWNTWNIHQWDRQ